MEREKKLNFAWRALRMGMGLGPLLAGADKFTNLLANWEGYIARPIGRRLPMRQRTFMRATGVIEMGVGLAILTKWPRWGGYVAAGWLTAIAGNLIVGKRYDIVVRDLEMALGALVLAKLTEARTIVQPAATPRRHIPPGIPAMGRPQFADRMPTQH